MSKFRFRSYLDDGLFVVLVMAAALASAALEVGALVGAYQSESAKMAKGASAGAVKSADAGASAAGRGFVGMALARAAR